MRQNGAFVADDDHGGKDASGLEGVADGGSLCDVEGGVDVRAVKANLHETATKHHAYDRGA